MCIGKEGPQANCIRQPIFTLQASTRQESKYKFRSGKCNARALQIAEYGGTNGEPATK
jgi:hypothetical protein